MALAMATWRMKSLLPTRNPNPTGPPPRLLATKGAPRSRFARLATLLTQRRAPCVSVGIQNDSAPRPQPCRKSPTKRAISSP
jgi:hypothetical protein